MATSAVAPTTSMGGTGEGTLANPAGNQEWLNDEIDQFHKIRSLIQTELQKTVCPPPVPLLAGHYPPQEDVYDLIREAVMMKKKRVVIPISFFTNIGEAFTRR